MSEEYIILHEAGTIETGMRMIEVHETPGDNTLLFMVYPPLQVPVASIYTNWEKNEMWIQVAHSVNDHNLKGSEFDELE